MTNEFFSAEIRALKIETLVQTRCAKLPFSEEKTFHSPESR